MPNRFPPPDLSESFHNQLNDINWDVQNDPQTDVLHKFFVQKQAVINITGMPGGKTRTAAVLADKHIQFAPTQEKF